jgi:hypothetical protein
MHGHGLGGSRGLPGGGGGVSAGRQAGVLQRACMDRDPSTHPSAGMFDGNTNELRSRVMARVRRYRHLLAADQQTESAVSGAGQHPPPTHTHTPGHG